MLYLASAADYLKRTTSLLPSTGVVVWMGWFRQRSLPVGAAYNTYFGWLNNTPASYTQWSTIRSNRPSTADDYMQTKAGATDDQMPVRERPAGVWRHFAILSSTSTAFQQMFVNGKFVNTTSVARDFLSAIVTEIVGGDSFGNGDIDVAYVRQWSGNSPAWTTAAILAEAKSATVVRTAGLHLNTPLDSDLLDISGNARHWTQQGSGVFTPTVFSDLIASFAPDNFLTISSFPYSRVVTVAEFNAGTFGDDVNEVWFKRAAPAAAALGVHVSSPATMQTDIYEANTLVDIAGATDSQWVEVAAGQSYYVKVVKNGGGAIAADITVSAESAVINPTIEPADLVINDDEDRRSVGLATSYAATVYSPTGVLRGFVPAIPGGEMGGGLLSGIQLWHDRYLHHGSRLALFSPALGFTLALDTSPTLGTVFPNITDDGTKFFVVNRSNGNVHTVSATGTVSAATATLSGAGGSAPLAAGVNAAGTILYYSYNGSIRRWDLVGNVALSDLYLVPEFATDDVWVSRTPNTHPGDLLVLPDGSIVTWYENNTLSKSVLLHISAAGALLHSYTYTWPLRIDHLSPAADMTSTFVNIWLYTDVDFAIGRFQRLNINTGVAASTFDKKLFSAGVNLTSGDSAVFGPSTSCTFTTALRQTALDEGTDLGGSGDIGGGDRSIPDCCDKGTPTGDIGTNPDPIGILPGWLASCVGGGQPDTNMSLADGEIF